MENMTRNQRIVLQKFLFNEINTLNRVIQQIEDTSSISGKMGALVRKVRQIIKSDNEIEQVTQLLHLVYKEWKFHCNDINYFSLNNLRLDSVLQHKEGMPVSLGAIVLYLAASLDLAIYPVNFPTQLILRAEMRDENDQYQVKFINPRNGEFISREEMLKLLEGEFGFDTELKTEYLQIADMLALQERLETAFKIVLTAENRYEDILRLIQYHLIFQPEDPYEIRDRGMILASLGCYQAAIDDLTYFIDQCPDDPTALMLKMEMSALRQQNKEFVLH